MVVSIALLGKSGSGKTTVAARLVEHHGFQTISSGKVCREVAHIVFAREDKETLNNISLAIRKIDQNAFLEAALRDAKPNRDIVFDSIRYKSDYYYLKTIGYKFLKVEVERAILEQRLKIRGQAFTPDDLSHESEISLDTVECDWTINNENKGRENFLKEIDRVVSKLRM